MKNIETEFKWDANVPRAFFRMKQAVQKITKVKSFPAGQMLHIQDVYLDTPDAGFEKEQIAFRVRQCNAKWEATFKTRTEIINGKAVRREETLPLPGVKNLKEALSFLNRKRTWLGLQLEHLTPLFSVSNKRTIYTVCYGGATAELAFDNCVITVAGRRLQMKEIELELKKGNPLMLEELAKQLTDRSGLSYMRVSKVKTAYGLRKLWGEK